MSQDIIKEIEKAIDEAAEKNADKFYHAQGDITQVMPWSDCKESFQLGAAFVLPLLRKAIEQRDCRIEAEYGILYNEKDNKELLDLLFLKQR